MKAVILCNSDEKGLMPINERTPDCLLDICGETPLSLCVDAAKKAEISELYILADRYIPQLQKECADHELTQCSGSIGASLCELAEGGPLLVMCAKYASAPDISALFEYSLRSADMQPAAVLLAHESCLGHCCPLRSEEGRLAELCADGWNDSGEGDGYFGGAAVLGLELCSRLGEFDFKTLEELICALLADDELIRVCYSQEQLLKPDTPENYRCACLSALRRQPPDLPELPNVTLIPPVYIGRDAVIADGCVISESVIGRGARIGARCELSGCVIGECAAVSADVTAEQAVVCRAAELGASVRLGRECAVGENSMIGSGSELASGVRLRSGAQVSADSLVTEDILDGCACSCACSHSLDDNDCFSPDKTAYAAIDCVRLGMSAGGTLAEGSAVICGFGGDEASAALLCAFESGLSAVGVTAMSIGECSPAEVMFLISRLGAQLGCFVSSDNSCKVKLISKGGLPLDTDRRSSIERSLALRLFRTLPYSSYAERRELSGAKALYTQFLMQNLPQRFVGLSVDVRCSDIRLSRLADRLFRPRGDVDGKRVIFHVSNDGSECTAYTDLLGNISHERLVLLAAKACFERDLPVSLPFSFPTAADTIAESLAGKLYRYRHSPEPDSDTAARTVAARPDNFFVRDAFALISVICSYIDEHRVSFDQAMMSLPEFATAKRCAAVGMSANEAYKRLGASREGGEGFVGRYGGRASVRPLKDKKGLIIYAESTSAETAADICEDILKTLGISQ